MNTDLHFSSATDDWATPPELFRELHAQYDFTLDPCCTPENAKCAKFYTREQDGLKQSWNGERVFCNPPYGRQLPLWVKKCFTEAHNGAELVVMLIPSRTDTDWFHSFCIFGKIRWIRGRLKFGGCVNSAPFPSMVVKFPR